MGASNPFPGSPLQQVLDTSLGYGFFGRIPWPYSLYTEFGISSTVYLSTSTRALTTIPVYSALAYELPFELPVKFFLKGGPGMTYVVARPENTARWNPTAFAGLEASFVAARKVRIGVRIDAYRIFETNLNIPQENQNFYPSVFDDPRIPNPANYRLKDGDFFNFGIMVSLLL